MPGTTITESMDQKMIKVTENLSPTIYKIGTTQNPWLSQVPEEAWQDGLGYTQESFTFPEASLPNGATWELLSESSPCSMKGDVLEVGYERQVFGLARFALNSGKICLTAGRSKFMIGDQVSNVITRFAEVFNMEKAEKAREDYTKIAKHKVILAPNLPGLNPAQGKSTFEEVVPVSVLTEGALDLFAGILDQLGAGPSAGGRASGAPAYMLFTSAETSRSIMRLNPADRDDYRNDPESLTKLLAPLGVNKTQGRFAHVIDYTTPRWKYDTAGAEGKKWVRVPRLLQKEGADGTKISALNPDYLTAEFEDSIIYLPTVMARVVQTSLSSLGGGTSFGPSNVNGTYSWINIRNEETNVDGNIGWFRGVYVAGAKPIDPRLGFVIRHKRYDDPGIFVDASGKPLDISGK